VSNAGGGSPVLISVDRERVRNPEHGGSGVKLFLMLFLLGSMVFAGIKIMPAYIDNYQMQDAVESEARFAIGSRLALKDIRADVLKKVKEIGIPATDDDIKVVANQGVVQITIDYSVPIDLLVYKYTKDFHVHADNRSI
jgi:Domain of unknown function (DUF4845)